MQMNETTRFLITTLGAFLLSLGGASLLFSVIERVFFELNGISFIVMLSFATLAIGGLLLLASRKKSI